jgi:hypothetical protein
MVMMWSPNPWIWIIL